MNTTATMYTTEDLEAARYAEHINTEFQVQYDGGNRSARTPEDVVRIDVWTYDILDDSDMTPEERQIIERTLVMPRIAQYHRGSEVLATARIVASERFDATLSGSNAIEELEQRDLVSPLLRVFAGHVATNEMARYLALVAR